MIVGPGGAAKVPPLALVDLAIVHTAIYDAVNAIEGYPFEAYAISPHVASPASEYAAAAQAGHDALLALYPANSVQLDAALATSLSFVPDGNAKTNGISVGQETAAGIIALRANDGRNNVSGFTTAGGTGVWVPTPPGFLPAQAPWARFITPWALESPDQFRAEAPPDLGGHEWVRDYNEVKALGAKVGSVRTPDQTDIGVFWSDSPPLMWNRTWRELSTQNNLSLGDNARYFAMLSTASSDSLIACWDSKFYWAFWRPDTSIPAGGGNAALLADTSWISNVVTPNHPEYPAAHGCFSSASTHTLETFFGTDDMSFTINSLVAGVVTPVRSYSHFSDALEEVGNARIYGGMHYRNSTEKGAHIGKKVAHFTSRHLFRKSHGRDHDCHADGHHDGHDCDHDDDDDDDGHGH